jgi:MtN3 and saliva related transmembrane protein
MDTITINGYIGGILSAILFIPQLFKIYKTKSVNDISFSFVFIGILGPIFSFIYYIEISAYPLIYTTIFSLFTRIILGIFKFYYQYYFPFKILNIEETLLSSEC